MLLFASLVFAGESVAQLGADPNTQDAGTEYASGWTCSDPWLERWRPWSSSSSSLRIPEAPLLLLDGIPIAVERYPGHGTSDLIETLPGYARGSLSGFPLSDATVLVDGVRFDVGGRVGR